MKFNKPVACPNCKCSNITLENNVGYATGKEIYVYSCVKCKTMFKVSISTIKDKKE